MPATGSQHAVLPVGAAAQFATQSAFEAHITQFKYGPVVPELLPVPELVPPELVVPEDVPPPDAPDPEPLELAPEDDPSSPEPSIDP